MIDSLSFPERERVVRMRIFAACLVIGVCAGGACLAAEAFEPGGMELYPTLSAVGIEIPYTGDAQDRPEMVWRRFGEADWRNGVAMTVDPVKRFVWASIWPLEQGETIEVKVTFGRRAPIEGKVTTRTMVLEGAGRKYYVSPDGSDEAPGIKGLPFRTLAHAAGVVKPGDTVFAMSGVYPPLELRGLAGEENAPIIFAAAEGERPVIDGSVEIAKGDKDWRELGEGVYVRDADPRAIYKGYVAQDALRSFWYRELEDFHSDALKTGRSWHVDKGEGKLYVRTGDSSAALEHTYRVAVHSYGIDLTASRHVVVRGFQVRYCGSAAVLFDEGTTGCTVVDNVLHHVPFGVRLGGTGCMDNAIWRNEIYDEGLVDFTWSQIKASGYPRQGVMGIAGRGTSICHNTIHGYFDAIAPVSWKHPDDLEYNRDFDIMYNRIRNIGDDAIEVDGGGVNMRIHRNVIRNCFAAISLAPIERGPVYCTRNDATFYMLMFKLNVGDCTSLGWAYSYHNSGYSLINTKSGAYGGVAVSFPAGGSIPIANKVFLNNALIGNTYGIRSAYPKMYLDYDCFYHVPGDQPLGFSVEVPKADGTWEKRRFPTIGDFSNATGWEEHGIYADPQFAATPGMGEVAWTDYTNAAFGDNPQAADCREGDFTLVKTSPCLDSGVVIRGVNEDYAGDAPDRGAHELDE